MNLNKIAIWGFGVTGQAALKYFLHTKKLNQSTMQIDVFDSRAKINFDETVLSIPLENVNFNFEQNEIENIEDYDLLLISPSVPENHPTILKARKKGITIHNDVSYFLSAWKKTGKKSVGVTGSNGKSTVVSLIHGALQSVGVKSILVGNIGESPLDYLLDYENGDLEIDTPILELSSYQLESFGENEFTDISVITNISPNHLDHHNNSMNEYVGAKLKIIGSTSEIITVTDDPGIQKYVLPNIKKYIGISLENIDENLEQFTDESSRNLKGEHNLYNIAVVLEVLKKLNINLSDTFGFIKNYSGLEHRIEFVREIDGIQYINDSKSTSPDATKVALEAFGDNKNIILIAGGSDKKVSFGVLGDYINKYVKLLLILDHDINDKLIKLASNFDIENYIVSDLQEGIDLTKKHSKNGDIVLLSPGAASLGRFKNFEDRGKIFKEIVNNL
jgi:UDP-N-acetylmuramoylalanine--D-glutamate ligase